jgi:hypothetical protein
MNTINKVPNHELYFNLSRLTEIAKTVAYAKNEADAEFFTVKYLRPQIEKVEELLKEARTSRD